jgi:hypothetical protein
MKTYIASIMFTFDGNNEEEIWEQLDEYLADRTMLDLRNEFDIEEQNDSNKPI